MTIKSVAILGAGAVGSCCIYGLSKCDIQLSVVAKDERYERLKKNGCLINNVIYLSSWSDIYTLCRFS